MRKFPIFLMFRNSLNEASSYWEKKQEYHWTKMDLHCSLHRGVEVAMRFVNQSTHYVPQM